MQSESVKRIGTMPPANPSYSARQLGHQIRDIWASKYKRGSFPETPLSGAQAPGEGISRRGTGSANDVGSPGDAVSHNPCPQPATASRELLVRDVVPKVSVVDQPRSVTAEVSGDVPGGAGLDEGSAFDKRGEGTKSR